MGAQMFLFLTSRVPELYGGREGRIFTSPEFYTVTPADDNGKRRLIPNRVLFTILGLDVFPFVGGVRGAQLGAHGLPVIMSKSGVMFEVQPGPISKAGKPLVLNKAGKQVEVESTAMRNGKLVLLDKAGKAITSPRLIISKQVPQDQLQRLGPQQLLLPELVPQHEVLMRLVPEREVVTPPAVAHRLGTLKPVDVNPKRIAQAFPVNGRPIFLNAIGGVIDTEEGQADDGVLIAQNGSLIYYMTMVNQVMAYFLTGTKDGGITPTPTQFPTKPPQLAPIIAFAAAHNTTLIDPNALAIEVKSAWIETTGLANPDQYITAQAVIPEFNRTDPKHWTPTGKTKTTTLALVGMHVVGSAKGHPEMIWATFEHFGSAPNGKFRYISTSPPNPHIVGQSTTGTWLFSANGSTGPFNKIRQTFVSPDIVGSGGNTIGASDVLRSSPFGAVTPIPAIPPIPPIPPNPATASDATSNSQIIGIDNSILSNLAALPGAPDVRTNYYMTGATWTILGAAPSGSFSDPPLPGKPRGNEVGTSKLANTTMETFQQPSNCFTCHRTNNLNVSHLACQAGKNPDPCLNGIQPLF
jgi:hypothetical protein